MAEPMRTLLESWDTFSVKLRMKQGFDQQAYDRLTGALRELKPYWERADSIPRRAVIELVDIVPGMEALAPLYDEDEAQRIHECKYELQELVWDCLQSDDEDVE